MLRWVQFMCALLPLLLVGCGKKNEFETAKVSGTVLYKNEPIKIGSLVFVPTGNGPSAQANIDRNGNFDMGTYETADGAILGQHKVMIHALTGSGGTGLPEDAVKGDGSLKSIIPERFGDLEKSGLVVDVQPGTNVVNFELDDKEGKVVPVK